MGLVFVAIARRGGHARAPQPLPRRPRARALPGHAGGARDAAPRPAGPAAAVSAAGRRAGVRRARARRRRCARRSATCRRGLAAPARRHPPGAARGHPPHAALPRRHLADPGRDAAAPARRGGRVAARPPRRASPGSARSPSAAARASCGSGSRCPPPVLDLQRACERAARAAGFEREERPFRAHLTLGRWRERAARPDLPAGRPRHDAARRRSSSSAATCARRRRLHSARAVPAGAPGGRLGARDALRPPGRAPSPT